MKQTVADDPPAFGRVGVEVVPLKHLVQHDLIK